MGDRMRLWCIGRYQSSAGKYREGEEIVVSDEEGEFLLRDSPGSFAFEQPKAAAKPKGKAAAEPAFDVEAATVDEMNAFAEDQGIDLDGLETEEDIRAAIALAVEARGKVEEAKVGGAPALARPQRRGRAR